jgi:hypothetical protein
MTSRARHQTAFGDLANSRRYRLDLRTEFPFSGPEAVLLRRLARNP